MEVVYLEQWQEPSTSQTSAIFSSALRGRVSSHYLELLMGMLGLGGQVTQIDITRSRLGSNFSFEYWYWLDTCIY